MSPIGKVFIVLNLILAGFFVGFAGTYLQRATDWKERFTKKDEELTKEKERAQGELAAISEQLQSKDRELNKVSLLVQNAETENKKLTDENTRLATQLAGLEGNLAKLQAAHTTISAAIDRSTQDSQQAVRMSMTAKEERDAALSAKQDAEKQLADANFKIAELEKNVADKIGELAAVTQSLKEQEMVAAVYRERYGPIGQPQPDLTGRVEQVSSNDLLTIAVENAGGVELKAGVQFAIFDGNGYKGEAVVTGAQNNMAFCRVRALKDNATISVGDRAKTNLGVN